MKGCYNLFTKHDFLGSFLAYFYRSFPDFFCFTINRWKGCCTLTITYYHIHYHGQVVYENDLYKHVHFPEMLIYYSGNFIQFKSMPSLQEFAHAADYLLEFHKRNGQNHVQFYFPPNQKPTKEFIDYFLKEQYIYSFTELYAIRPKEFKYRLLNPEVIVTAVDENTFPYYLDLQFGFDVKFGVEFAKQKAKIHQRHFEDSSFLQLLAYYKGEPVGTVDCIIGDQTVELDNLQVMERYRNLSVGTALQKYVMDHFPDHWVILIAEGEDTPREMYQKQNYQYYGFRYEAYKVFYES